MASDSLVSLDPVETLVFKLKRDTAPNAVLRVTNTSNGKVVFKVKTTQPSWYYVRPNQQVIDAGTTEEVVIVLIDSECSRFLERASSDKAERLDKHRFLVQAKEIDGEDYEKIIAILPNQRTEEYNRIWNTGSKEERKNLKLKVDFLYPEETSTQGPSQPIRSVSENVDNIKNHIAEQSSNSHSQEESQTTPENIYEELKSLRNKYDSVVEYTVQLTAERDLMVQKLEGIEKELTVTRSKSNLGDHSNVAMKSDRTLDKKGFLKGFSLAVVLIAALLSFFFGRYYKF